MRVIRAESIGLCFGVRDALTAAIALTDPADVAIYGQLVHDPAVQERLAQTGFELVSEADRHELPYAPKVLITAHGVSQRRGDWLSAAGKQLVDLTCPLVRRVHLAAQKLHADGYFVVVIGRRGHVEVQGIVEDLERFAIVQAVGDVARYPSNRLGVVCQTTTPPRAAEQIRQAIERLNSSAEIRFIDTVCQPTRDRQMAVERLLEQVQAVVVVGGRNSNNTRELAALCREKGVTAFHVESAADLVPCWFAGLEFVGLTAGTSTLDETIDEVERTLSQF
jgi:4-hydroxy-3-methylbut-2-enyl diphosphate reductase